MHQGEEWGKPVAGTDVRSPEQRLSDFYADFVEHGGSSFSYLARNPVAGLRALAQIWRLPKRRALLPLTVDGRAIHRTLSRPGPFGTPVAASGVSVLEVPANAGEYSAGAGKQTLRRKV